MPLSAWFAVLTPPVAAVGLWAYHRDYKKNKRVGLSGFVGVNAAFFGPVLVLGYSLPFFPYPSEALHYVGYALMVVGLVLCLVAMMSFRSSKQVLCLETSGLVTSGIYRYSRNPQYVFCGLFFLGYAFTGSSWLSYLGIGLYAVGVHVIVLIEERHLMDVYGAAYGQYRKTTPRYIGLPRKGNP